MSNLDSNGQQSPPRSLAHDELNQIRELCPDKTNREVAELLGVSERQLYYYLKGTSPLPGAVVRKILDGTLGEEPKQALEEMLQRPQTMFKRRLHHAETDGDLDLTSEQREALEVVEQNLEDRSGGKNSIMQLLTATIERSDATMMGVMDYTGTMRVIPNKPHDLGPKVHLYFYRNLRNLCAPLVASWSLMRVGSQNRSNNEHVQRMGSPYRMSIDLDGGNGSKLYFHAIDEDGLFFLVTVYPPGLRDEETQAELDELEQVIASHLGVKAGGLTARNRTGLPWLQTGETKMKKDLDLNVVWQEICDSLSQPDPQTPVYINGLLPKFEVLYVDHIVGEENQKLLDVLVGPENLVLIGPRGTGKSLVFELAVGHINDRPAREGELAVYVDAKEIISDLKTVFGTDGPRNDDRIELKRLGPIMVLCGIMEALGTSLERLGANRRKPKILEDDALGRRLNTIKRCLPNGFEKGNKYSDVFCSVREQLVSAAKLGVTISPSLLTLGEASVGGDKTVVKDTTQIHLPNTKGFIEDLFLALKRGKVKRLYIFLDDYSEVPTEYRGLVQEVIEDSFRNTPYAKRDVMVRCKVACYSLAESIYTVGVSSGFHPAYSTLNGFYASMDNEWDIDRVEEELGNYFGDILLKRLQVWDLGLKDIFAARDEKSIQQVMRTIARCTSGIPRKIGDLLSGLDANEGIREEAIFANAERRWVEHWHNELEAALPSSISPELKQRYFDLVERISRKTDEGLLIAERYLAANELRDQLQPLVNYGLIYPVCLITTHRNARIRVTLYSLCEGWRRSLGFKSEPPPFSSVADDTIVKGYMKLGQHFALGVGDDGHLGEG